MRRLLVSATLSLLVLSCASQPTPPPTVGVKKHQDDFRAPPPAQTATAAEAAPAETTDPAAEPAPPRDIEGALAKVEEGRKVQREKGEGGADEAIAAYREALLLDPRCAAALWELGWSYQVKDDWVAAIEAWDALTAIDPKYPELAEHYPIAKMRADQARALAELPDPGSLPPPELDPREGPTVTITAVGDLMMGQAWPEKFKKLPPGNGEVIFASIKDRLTAADVTFANLETVVADEGKSRKCGPRSKSCYAFRIPTSYMKTVKAAGFDVLSIANNHTGDFGEEGRQDTAEALDAVGILHSGPVGDIASWTTNGLRVAMVAFSTGGGVYRVQDVDTAKRVVAEIDRKHDLVIVSFHGGAEGRKAAHVPHGTEMFLGENRGDLRTFTHAVIDAGADLVLGHGPHLLRGMQIYKGRLIAYSLGNFSAWNTHNLSGALGVSGILNVRLAPNGVLLSASFDPLSVIKPGIPEIDPKGRGVKIIRELSQEDFGDPVLDEQGRWSRK